MALFIVIIISNQWALESEQFLPKFHCDENSYHKLEEAAGIAQLTPRLRGAPYTRELQRCWDLGYSTAAPIWQHRGQRILLFQPWPRAAGKQLPDGILAKPQVRPTACGETSLVQVEHALDLAWACKFVLQFLPESTRGTSPAEVLVFHVYSFPNMPGTFKLKQIFIFSLSS